MNNFIEIPANKRSLSKRKPLYGVGINDVNYIIGSGLNICPFYRKWQDMLKRCYSSKYQKKHPTYIDCTTCSEWLIFSSFKKWMQHQNWEGMQLDKDFLVLDNKLYSPELCVFIPKSLNTLLNDCRSSRGIWPQGVCFNKQKGKFKAQCRVSGKSINLGLFSTPEDASKSYTEFKKSHILKIAEKYRSNTRLYSGIIKRANRLHLGSA